MSTEDGVSLLLKTALEESNDEVSRQLGAKVVGKLGHLALAIVQAGAVSNPMAVPTSHILEDNLSVNIIILNCLDCLETISGFRRRLIGFLLSFDAD